MTWFMVLGLERFQAFWRNCGGKVLTAIFPSSSNTTGTTPCLMSPIVLGLCAGTERLVNGRLVKVCQPGESGINSIDLIELVLRRINRSEPLCSRKGAWDIRHQCQAGHVRPTEYLVGI